MMPLNRSDSAGALPPPRYIDTNAALQAWLGRIAGAGIVGVDTEGDSFHHYRERVCLIQMTALGEDVVIDPFAVTDLSPLGQVLADPGVTKIFHDAGYDLIGLARDFGFGVTNIFDTMVASRLLGWRRFGLAAILSEHFGYEANKRLQRSDWARRPLTPEQLDYARFDTHFLPAMMELLQDKLRASGRLSWAEEDFTRLPEVAARVPMRKPGIDPEGFWRVRGVRALSPKAKGRAQALYVARERIAERLDRPVFKIFNDDTLVALAKQPPASLRDLQPRPGLRRAGIERFGREIVAALRKAQPVTAEPPSNSSRRRSGRFLDPQARGLYEALRGMRREIAEQLGLEPEVALSNGSLEIIARQPPRCAADVRIAPELAGWRYAYFAEAIAEVVRGYKGGEG